MNGRDGFDNMKPGFGLSKAQQEIVAHRGGKLQIIACAGAGKTEAISRRVAALLAEGVSPDSIIAFTFTEKAGAELKERIYRRAGELLKQEHLDRLSPMFVGTIHGWCFRFLQEYVPRFGDYEVLDEHRHAALLSREARKLDLKALSHGGHWDGIRRWERIVDVIGNELLNEKDIEASGYADRWRTYLDILDGYHILTFSRLIAEAVAALEDPPTAERVRAKLRYLLVDEYQDINPAQERLIRLLSAPPIELCVVGDDDQAIYQWRGSDIANIVGFATRYEGVRTIPLLENRRSRPEIVESARAFAEGIPVRLRKSMTPVRDSAGLALHLWSASTDMAEAETIAATIKALVSQGWRHGEIAILLRSVRGSGAPIIDALRNSGIPVTAGGRTGLFMTAELSAMGELYAFLSSFQWRDGSWSAFRTADVQGAATILAARFPAKAAAEIAAYAEDWKSFYSRLNTRTVDLVEDYYRFLDWLGLPLALDPELPADASLLGSLARFSTILADYEHATKRGRYIVTAGGRRFEQGVDRGKSYWFGLGNYLLHYAFGAYEDFEAEETLGAEAVQILTVHQAKGLEWPIVFLPCLVDGRFPSSRTGKDDDWPFDDEVLPATTRRRYAGCDADERRLFYTAMTRARDMLYCSCFGQKTRSFSPSPYLLELAGGRIPPETRDLPLPAHSPAAGSAGSRPVELSFSDLATWEECGYRYRLGSSFGFENRLVEELGYGKAVHHVLSLIANRTRSEGRHPEKSEVVALIEDEFYAPFANPSSHEQMKKQAIALVDTYLDTFSDDLGRIWATERPFELHTEDGLVSGRADAILEGRAGSESGLAIVDYKVSTNEELEHRYEWQLRVYTHAARREGLKVEAAWLHDLRAADRRPIDIDEKDLDEASRRASAALASIRGASFPARPDPSRCSSCDYRQLCGKRSPAARSAEE